MTKYATALKAAAKGLLQGLLQGSVGEFRRQIKWYREQSAKIERDTEELRELARKLEGKND